MARRKAIAVLRARALALSALLALGGCSDGVTEQGKGSGTLRVGVRDNIMNFSRLNEQTGKYYGLEIGIATEMAMCMGYADV